MAMVPVAVLLSSRPGIGLEDPRRHHVEVLALASDGQVLKALALVMQALALALASDGQVLKALTLVMQVLALTADGQVFKASALVMQVLTLALAFA